MPHERLRHSGYGDEYDGTGRRIWIYSDYTDSTPGTTTDDYHLGQQVIETRENAAVKYQFVWSPRYIDAPILRDTLDSGRLSHRAGPSASSTWLDANYNVTGLLKQRCGTRFGSRSSGIATRPTAS